MKPSFFKNELLATSDPLNGWIFAGLWGMADREGRLEDRPRRIHLEINAGRAYEGTVTTLAWLAEQGFILRYAHGGGQYIQIVNFAKHQNPHPRETASVLPGPDASAELDDHDTDSTLGIVSTQPRQDLGNAKDMSSRASSSFPFPESSPSGRERALRADATEAEAETPPADRKDRATRIPADFALTPERRAVAVAEHVDPERTFAKFCNHWRAKGGQAARKVDWEATWRNWCMEDADRAKRNGAGASKPTRYEQLRGGAEDVVVVDDPPTRVVQ